MLNEPACNTQFMSAHTHMYAYTGYIYIYDIGDMYIERGDTCI